MENIRQAVERAKQSKLKHHIVESGGLPGRPLDSSRAVERKAVLEVTLNLTHLSSRRIVGHDGTDQFSRSYDMLRTQVLQTMGLHNWQVVGVTSPTPACGKSVTAINLAFSIARDVEQSVVLVDMDLQKPQVADYLGLTIPGRGLLGLLKGQSLLENEIIVVRVGNEAMTVLPTAGTNSSSDFMVSRPMRDLMQVLKTSYRTIIIDLPPMLASGDVIAILPELDCVLLVAAVGVSTVSEVEECARHLRGNQLVRVVVNKAADTVPRGYY